MRLSRSDAIPVLATIAGGTLGVAITLGTLLSVRSVEDAPVVVMELDQQEEWVLLYPTSSRGEIEYPIRVFPEGVRDQGVRDEILGPLEPPVYVDGVRVESSFLDDLNGDDIESATVLKGPSAVRLYGEEASGGVVIITLKADAPTGR